MWCNPTVNDNVISTNLIESDINAFFYNKREVWLAPDGVGTVGAVGCGPSPPGWAGLR